MSKRPERKRLGYSVQIKGSTWRLRWRDPLNGRQCTQSLHLKADRPKHEAMVLAATIMEPIQQAAQAKAHYLPEPAVWENAIAVARQYVAAMGYDPSAAKVTVEFAADTNHTVGDLADRFDEKIQAELDRDERSAWGVKSVRSRLAKFVEWAGRETPLSSLTPAKMDEYRNSLQLSGNTIKSNLGTVRALFNYGQELDWILISPLRKMKKIRTQTLQPNLWTLEALNQVRAMATQSGWKVAPLIGYYQGIRLRDIALARWEQIDEEFTLRFIPAKTRRSSGIEVTSPLHPAIIEALPPRQAEGFVFPDLAATSQGVLSNQFRAMVEASGINRQPNPNLRPLTFHALRHTFTTRLKQLNCPDTISKALTGHSTRSDTHSTYIQFEVATLRRWIKKL